MKAQSYSRWLLGLCIVSLQFLCATQVRGDVSLPSVFGSHMVLQQKLPVKVWGWAESGEKVTVAIGDQTATVTAGDNKKWKVELPCPAAGGPYTLTVSGNNKVEFTDVLVGEVWVASGQSNMQWPMTAALNPEEEIKAANFPNIRLFSVTRIAAPSPQENCQATPWAACTPETVKDFSAVGYFFGRKLHQELNVPVGIINTSWGGTLCEAWTSKSSLEGNPEFKPILDRVDPAAEFKKDNPHQPGVLFNQMINPLVPFSIRGAIWYQGESNVGRAEQYVDLFPTMIRDWRSHWGQGDFPFLFVQLAPYDYDRNGPKSELCELWEAQLKTLKNSPNTGMAVTTDIGDVKDIHPRNKQEVGRRLALWALAGTYGKKDVDCTGPLFSHVIAEGNKLRVHFHGAEGGLQVKDDKTLALFQVAGADGAFVAAKAVIDGETVVVEAASIEKPTMVRFAWDETSEPALLDASGLPASPFRSDNLPMKTAGRR
jgi:sialate O-acetylesterase